MANPIAVLAGLWLMASASPTQMAQGTRVLNKVTTSIDAPDNTRLLIPSDRTPGKFGEILHHRIVRYNAKISERDLEQEFPVAARSIGYGSKPASHSSKSSVKGENKDNKPDGQKEAAGRPINVNNADEPFLRESMKTLHITGTAEEKEDARPIY